MVNRMYRYVFALLLLSSLTPARLGLFAQTLKELKVNISLGHTSPKSTQFFVRLVPSHSLSVDKRNAWSGSAGNGHVESQTYTVSYPEADITSIQGMHVIWSDLIAHSDTDTVRRLAQDPAWRIDFRKIRFELNPEGTRGFSLTIDQLLHCRSFWIPSLDLYVSTGDNLVSFSAAQQQLSSYAGMRILDQVRESPEASYESFKEKWANMGDPSYAHPAQQGPGHIIGLSWDSTIEKFGIDRGAGVWSDYGNADQFRFWFGFANLAEGIGTYWKSQTLENGLPIVTTVLERDGVHYEVEQFAYPLNGPSEQRRGDLPMVLMQRVRMTDISGEARIIPLTVVHERSLPAQDDPGVIAEQLNGQFLLEENAHHNVLLAIRSEEATVSWAGVQEQAQKEKRVDVTLSVSLPAKGTRELFLALPSPAVTAEEHDALGQLDYASARTRTVVLVVLSCERGAI